MMALRSTAFSNAVDLACRISACAGHPITRLQLMTVCMSLPYRPNVGIMLFDANARVFLGRRADISGGIWQFPQGGIDANETPLESAFRELHEEVGTRKATLIGEHPEWVSYDFPPHVRDGKLGKRFRGQTQRWFAFRFTGDDSDFNLNLHSPPEFDCWKWASVEEVFDHNLGFKRGIYQQIVPAMLSLVSSRGSSD